MWYLVILVLGIVVGYAIRYMQCLPRQRELDKLRELTLSGRVLTDEEVEKYVRTQEWVKHLLVILKELRNTIDKLENAIRETTSKVKGAADALEMQRDKLRNAITDVEKSSEVINEALQGVDSISKQLEIAANDLAVSTEKLSSAIGQIEDSTAEAERGLGDVEKVMNKEMEHVREDRDRLKHLESVIFSIGTITDQIEKIAKKTKLLSLNASIEAARAGEAGKGFAVVAMEIRNLADSSREAAEDVRETVSDLITLIKEAYSQSEERVVDMKALEKLLHITNDKVRSIMDAIESINVMGEDLAAVSEELAASTSQVAESIESITMSMDTLNGAIHHMASLERELAQLRQEIDEALKVLQME